MQRILDAYELKSFVDSFSEGILFTDADLTIRWLNPMAEYLLEISSKDFNGKPVASLSQKHPRLLWIFEDDQPQNLKCWELLGCDDSSCPLWKKSFTDCWTEKTCPICTSPSAERTQLGEHKCPRCQIYKSYSLSKEGEILRSTNEKIILQVHSTWIRNQQGPVIGRLMLLRDITQDRELTRMKEDFLSALAHEFRSPLTSIRSYTEILLNYSDTDPETQKEFLQIIHEENLRLDQMIEDTMELQRLESARSTWNNEEIVLPEIIDKVLSDHENSLQRKKITCEIDVDPECPKIWADSDKIYHVISTLLRSIANRTPAEDVVRLKAFPMKGQRETDINSLIKFTLSNTPHPSGGTESSHPPSNYPPVSQQNELFNRKKSMGLGFILCKKILDQYNGTLWLEHEETEPGYTFHFILPSCIPLVTRDVQVEEKRSLDKLVKKVRPKIQKDKNTILIVDDDPNQVNALTIFLTKEGYQVHSTTSAQRALDMTKEEKTDLIISDISMPEMDGYSLFEAVKQNESSKMIPFIFISARGEEDKIKGLKIGVDDYLTKPFDIKELAARVETLLGRVEEYKDISRFDGLTGALTRKAFEESMSDEILKAQQSGNVLSAVMVDLDYFKKVNDTYGHQAGDFVLISFVQFLLDNLRAEDILGRYGGEEFCIIMPNVQKQTACEILERIQKIFSKTSFYYEQDDLTIDITASFGVSSFPGDSIKAEGLIKKADAALYTAKEQGRNQVVIHGHEISSSDTNTMSN